MTRKTFCTGGPRSLIAHNLFGRLCICWTFYKNTVLWNSEWFLVKSLYTSTVPICRAFLVLILSCISLLCRIAAIIVFDLTRYIILKSSELEWSNQTMMYHVLVALQDRLELFYHYMIGSLIPRLSPRTNEKPKATENPGNDRYLPIGGVIQR